MWPLGVEARLADALTLGRAMLAAPVAAVVWWGWWTPATLLLAAAWWSDFLDGHLARRADGDTRLGKWDLGVDTVVGGAAVVGLVGGGHIGWMWGVGVGVMGAGFVVTHNPALGMLVQAVGYGVVLWISASHSTGGLTVAVLTIVAILILNRSRFARWVLPTFFQGLVGRRHRRL